MVFLITIGISIGWVLINIKTADKKIDVLQVEREKFIGRWVSSDGDEGYYFFPDGTLTVNQTTYHFGMGVSSEGYTIYNGIWKIVKVSDINGSSHFEFYINYTRIEKHGMGIGILFESVNDGPHQFSYKFKESNKTLLVLFSIPSFKLLGAGLTYTTYELEKVGLIFNK